MKAGAEGPIRMGLLADRLCKVTGMDGTVRSSDFRAVAAYLTGVGADSGRHDAPKELATNAGARYTT